MTNEITNNEMALLKGYAVAAADKSQPPEAQGMRLTNFRWHVNPGIILALIAKVESLAADAERLHFEMHEATNSLVARLAAPAVANAAKTDELPPCAMIYSGARFWSEDQMCAAIAATAPNTAVMLTDEQIAEIHDATPQTGNWVSDFARAIAAATGPDAKLVELLQSWMNHNGSFGERVGLVNRTVAALAAHAGQGAKA